MAPHPRLLLAAVLAVAACGRPGSQPQDAGDAFTPLGLLEEGRAALASSPPSPRLAPLASEVENAAKAESGTAKGVLLSTLSGELHMRLYRLSGGTKEGDARAALESFAAASSRPDLDGCRAAILRAGLAGEIAHDPGVTYQELYLARRRYFQAAACVEQLEEALGRAAPFRPPATVLERLDRTLSAEGVPVEDAGVPSPKAEGHPRVTRLSRWTTADTARVIVELDRAAVYALEPDAGGRVKVRIDGAELALTEEKKAAPPEKDTPKDDEPAPKQKAKGLLTRDTLTKTDTGVTLTMDLAHPAYRRVFFLPDPFRIVVDVGTQPPTIGVASGPRPLHRVVIDPGHGGADPGAIGPTGLREKDVTLAIAKMVAPILARELKIVVRLTRGSDTFVSLEERAAVGNAFEADVFLSIHCNAAEAKGRRGIETYVLDTARDELAHRVAKRENGGGGASHGELRAILDDLKLAEVGGRSRHLATLIQKATMASLHADEKGISYGDVTDGGVHGAGFFVLVGARMPAALMEVSFISNAIEEGYLAKNDYRARVADAIVNALRAYRDGR